MTGRFCIGDHYYLCDNKILCQFDYEERLVLARLSSSYGCSLTQMKKLQATATSSSSSSSLVQGPAAAAAAAAVTASSVAAGSLQATALPPPPSRLP